jgi:hypothetical protein
MKSVFILTAKGYPVIFPNSTHTIYCNKAFLSRENAEAAIEKFKANCIKPKDKDDITYLDEVGIKINIIELKLENENEN